MAKKPHPADQAEIDKIAAATHFAVHLRAGPFDKITKKGRRDAGRRDQDR